jgi:small subunit ribosomal protein S11
MGMKEAGVVVKGVGSGRESGIRGFISKGINITSIKDVTPVPHNGPKPKKPRRV